MSFSDTVSFIRKLPHDLVASFHATLMEAREADILLHVIDASSTTVDFDMESVNRTLNRIGCGDHPRWLVFNKLDRIPEERKIDLQHLLAEHENSFAISAGTGAGVDLLVEKFIELGQQRQESGTYLIPHARADLVARLRQSAHISEETFIDSGIEITVLFQPGMKQRWENAIAEAGIPFCDNRPSDQN